MAGAGDHRIFAIGPALTRAERVYVHVGDDRQIAAGAPLPEVCERLDVKDADPGGVGVRIEIVVEDEIDRRPFSISASPQDEGARLMQAFGLCMQLG